MFLYLFAILVLYWPSDWSSVAIGGDQHTALVEINGIIGVDAEASADNIVGGLRSAFEDENTAGIIIRINSPGGSPVQSGYVNDEIIRLREKYPDTPLYAVITDMCASGGYYIAAAADKIYADKASIVGSIGVLIDGFGFTGTIEKLGVERRLLTAGEHKGILDPFSPINEEEVEHLQSLLDQMHRQFIDTVKKGRGDRLKGDDDVLFSGLFWSGEESLELGLVDALGSSSYVARDVIGVEEIVDFTVHETYLDRFARRFGTALASALASIFNFSSIVK